MAYDKLYNTLQVIRSSDPSNIVIRLEEILGETFLQKWAPGSEGSFKPNEMYIEIGKYTEPIKAGAEFTILFSRDTPKKYLKVKTVLLEFRIGRWTLVDEAPIWVNTASLIKFVDVIPDVVYDLPVWGTEYVSSEKQQLFLTTQSVMDKIIELLDRSDTA